MALKFRRGTTAQKSGSLAFGEPFVNTDLNTLMIGGASGDITLSTSALTGSYATTGSNTFVANQTISGSLLVNSTTSTLGQFVGNQNGYVEFSVKNTSTGVSASSDFVVYADTGTSTTNYIDMGINNSGQTPAYSYGGAFIGDALDGYIYNIGNDLWIGNASTSSKSIYIFNTGSAKPMIAISQDSLQLTGSLFVTNGITGSIRATNGVVSGSIQVLGGTGIISSSAQLSGTTITDLTIVNLTTVNETASVIFSSGSNRFGDFGNDTHQFTGSVLISGSTIITGSVSSANGFTGSLLGTASFATSASYALNGSSNAVLYQTASAQTVWTFNHYLQTRYPVISVYDNTDSVIIPQSITAVDTNTTTITFSSARTGVAVATKGGYVGSVVTSATTATSATSASVAISSSYALSASAAATTFTVGASSTTYGSYINTIQGANTVISTPTGSFTGAFYNYIASSGSNARAGQVIAVWNNTTTQFADVSTNDIGTTTVVTSSVALSAGNAVLSFTTNTPNWNIKTFVTYL
jgi:hypothetical protein